jgi:demethylmenaquinone methyltransferase/2-methoxy-6-polyprenyl-1,4-benzoquinol methylase
VDVVTAGYALRNAPSWREALRELARVLRPGGHLITLDFYRPENGLWRVAYLAYLSVMGRIFGRLWHHEPVAYGYIARSIAHFVSWREFADAVEDTGFRIQEVRSKLGGGIAIHHARRVQSPELSV